LGYAYIQYNADYRRALAVVLAYYLRPVCLTLPAIPLCIKNIPCAFAGDPLHLLEALFSSQLQWWTAPPAIQLKGVSWHWWGKVGDTQYTCQVGRPARYSGPAGVQPGMTVLSRNII
jgi:hypothetical protein